MESSFIQMKYTVHLNFRKLTHVFFFSFVIQGHICSLKLNPSVELKPFQLFVSLKMLFCKLQRLIY